MSLKKLPEIKAFDSLPGLTFEPDEVALSKWRPEVRAAGDDADITILDVIGDDMLGDGVSAKRISAALRKIGARDVTVTLNSPGGDFFEGVAIYNMLRQHPHKVTVNVVGLAASAASVIAMAGDQINIAEAGFVMIHNAWAAAIGNRHDMRAAADILEPFDKAMATLYAKRTGESLETVAEWMDKETWFSGDSAVEVGLADAILPDSAVEASASLDMKTIAAVRRVDTLLAKQGVTRSERRSLISELKGGKPGAAAPVTQNADAFRALLGVFPD